MFGDVDITGQLRIKSVAWKQDGMEEPVCVLEIYGVHIESAGEVYSEIVDIEDTNTNGSGNG